MANAITLRPCVALICLTLASPLSAAQPPVVGATPTLTSAPELVLDTAKAILDGAREVKKGVSQSAAMPARQA